VDYCHDRNLKVGVWIKKSDFDENNADFYRSLQDMFVDFICSDYPLEAR